MPSLPTYTEVWSCNLEDVASCFHMKYNEDTAAYMGSDYWEWWWWRTDPPYRWYLRNLLWEGENPPPYIFPVLCQLAGEDAQLTRGPTETALDFLRRCYCALNNIVP